MRIVSLVPSWTETLLEAGCDVVGRTRFCVHPEPVVKSIPIVGGTKDWHFERILSLKPDILVLDREENPKSMSEQAQIPFVDTHIETVADLPKELAKLAAALKAPKLSEFGRGWEAVLAKKPLPEWDGRSDFPGLIEWGVKPQAPISHLEYIIWKQPWMGVAQKTFIGSMLERCGWQGLLPKDHSSKYPELKLDQRDKHSTLLLFSSEPFPFLRVKNSLAELGFPFALVDGENFSWFGVRSLRFLERVYGTRSP